MKLKLLIFLFITFSILLIASALQMHAKVLNDKRLELIRLSKIQKVCMKSYPRKRKIFVERCSFSLAQAKIDKYLKEQPILFLSNSVSLDTNVTNTLEVNLLKQTLIKVLAIVNRVDDKIILSIEAHTDSKGTKKNNLELSQKRVDVLKKYFLKRTNLPYIVAIGYGESLPLNSEKSNRHIEINLKRIQK